ASESIWNRDMSPGSQLTRASILRHALVQSTESPLQVRLSNVQIGIGPRVKSSPLISFRDRLVKKAA
ncbi:hypothetical protein M3C56_005600, partial [Micrococcus luteus]|nr:hypothetical protein [Micrococcus luteus]